MSLQVVVVPIRVARVALHRRLVLHEPWNVGVRIGTAVIPTLVFTIVIAEILRDRFALSPTLFGALIIFALVNTLVPGLVLRLPMPEFETPEVPRLLFTSEDPASSGDVVKDQASGRTDTEGMVRVNRLEPGSKVS